MGDPLQHARSSAEKFGGVPSDYLEIHQIMDSSKLFLADWRHRAALHNTFGIYLMEEWIIGHTFERESDGEEVCTRTVVTQHILEDLNMVPTLGEFLKEMPLRRWMMRATPTEVERMKRASIADEAAHPDLTTMFDAAPAAVAATLVWRQGDPPINGWYLVDRKAAQKHEGRGCPSLYFYHGKWYLDSEDMMEQPTPNWYAEVPLDPMLDEPPEMAQAEASPQMSENAS